MTPSVTYSEFAPDNQIRSPVKDSSCTPIPPSIKEVTDMKIAEVNANEMIDSGIDKPT